jgi:hypothetical protein
MPLAHTYRTSIDSSIADLKNTGSERYERVRQDILALHAYIKDWGRYRGSFVLA